MSNELSQRPIDQNSKKERFYFMFYRQNCLKTTQKIVSNGLVKRIQPYHSTVAARDRKVIVQLWNTETEKSGREVSVLVQEELDFSIFIMEI